MLEKK